MMHHPQYRAETYVISANSTIEINRNAEFITCLEAPVSFKIAFDDAPATSFQQGLVYEAQIPFTKTRIENPHPFDISVEIGMGRGGIKDARFVFAGTIRTRQEVPPVMESLAPVSLNPLQTNQIVAADVRRKDLILKNLSSTEAIWIKGDAAPNETGHKLEPGEGMVLSTSAAVFAWNGSAGPLSVSVAMLREDV